MRALHRAVLLSSEGLSQLSSAHPAQVQQHLCEWHHSGTLVLQEPGFASGAWEAPVSLSRNGDPLKLLCVHIIFRSTAPKQDLLCNPCVRSTEHLVGS